MSSTITIPSRCHAYPNEWDGEQNAGIPYAFNDRIEIPQAEIDALEVAIKKAYVERDKKVLAYRANLAPTAEEVEATQ